MRKQNNCSVRLLHITDDTTRLINTVWDIAKTNNSLNNIETCDIDINNIENIINMELPIAEYINLVWCIEGMPRAFWDQLDRCRRASFWEQSLRILDITKFASNEHYFISPKLYNDPKLKDIYVKGMNTIESIFNELLDNGAATEDARGVIPLHINTRGTFSINLRELRRMIAGRSCPIAQGDYWTPVILGMIKELRRVLSDNVITNMIKLPCSGKSSCPIESNVRMRLTEEDKNLLCPIYLNKYMPEHERESARDLMVSRDSTYIEYCHEFITNYGD